MSYLLLALGLLLVFIEFYLPGAVMGVIGSLLIIASLFLFIMQNSSPLLVMLYLVVVVISVILLIKFALWRIVKNRKEGTIYSDDAQVGYKASHFDEHAIGKTGVVLSDLKPGGFILVDKQKHAAISLSGYLAKGTSIRVVGGQEESLIVQALIKD